MQTSGAGGRHNMPPPPASWPFDCESGVRVTCDVGYPCANFSLPRPLCSRLRPDVRDRETDVRRAASRNASILWGVSIKMEGKTIFRGVWNSLAVWPDWPWPPPQPLPPLYFTTALRHWPDALPDITDRFIWVPARLESRFAGCLNHWVFLIDVPRRWCFCVCSRRTGKHAFRRRRSSLREGQCYLFSAVLTL